MTSQRLPPDSFPEPSIEEIEDAIREGYEDIKARRYFKSTGDFHEDLRRLRAKQRGGWK